MTTTTTLPRLNATEALAAIRDGALLIDVRSEAGRHRDGEAQGAIIVPKAEVVDLLTKLVSPKSADQKIVVFCGSIKGSEPVLEKLLAAGIPNVFDVDGGFAALTTEGGLTRIERARPVA